MWKLSNCTLVSLSLSSPLRRQEMWAAQAIRTHMPAMARTKAISLYFMPPLMPV